MTTGAAQAAAGLSIAVTGTTVNNDTVDLTLPSTVTWNAAATVTGGWAITGLTTSTLIITATTPVTSPIVLTGVKVTTASAAAGPLTAAVSYVSGGVTTAEGTTPAIANLYNSGFAGATVAAPTATNIVAGAAVPGTANTNSYVITLPSTTMLQIGDSLSLTFNPPGGCTATNFMTVANGGTAASTETTAAFTTQALAAAPGCAATNTVTYKVTTAGTTPGGTVTISGIILTAPATATLGADVVSGYYTATTGGAGALTVPTNANIVGISVSSVGLAPTFAPGSLAQSMGSVVVQEPVGGAITAPGYVCLSLTNGNTWANTAATLPTVSVSPGSGAVITAPVVVAAGYVGFNVTTPSSAAASYTVSGLTVNASATATGSAGLTVLYGATATCTGGTTVPNTVTPFSVTSSSQAIYGQNADGTTAMEFETAFKGCTEVGGNVVLATDAQPYDALAAAYLEAQLGTGILITSPTSLSTETISALRAMGVQNVYVVGGPLAVSPADLAQLAALPAYTCGGGSLTGKNINVIQAATTGANADATAQLIDNYVTAGSGIITAPSAYSVATATTGGGLYNDTIGNSSTVAPAVAGKTAIVVTDTDFRDAMAAAGIAYQYKLPVILTTPTALGTIASSELKSLGITQVIALGGQLALSDAVVTSIQGMGISVLRIAGQDYTDTAAQLAKFEGAAVGSGLAWKASTVLVAQGQRYSDALGAAALSGLNSEPVVLTLGPTLGVGQYTITVLHTAGTTGLGSGVTGNIQVLGGPLAVTAAQIAQMQQAL